MPTMTKATGGFMRVEFEQSEVESLLAAEAAKLAGAAGELVKHVYVFNQDAATPKAWVLLSSGEAAA